MFKPDIENNNCIIIAEVDRKGRMSEFYIWLINYIKNNTTNKKIIYLCKFLQGYFFCKIIIYNTIIQLLILKKNIYYQYRIKEKLDEKKWFKKIKPPLLM